MYHTRPISTHSIITALIARVYDSLHDPEPQYDTVLSNVTKEELTELFTSLNKFNESFLESRDIAEEVKKVAEL